MFYSPGTQYKRQIGFEAVVTTKLERYLCLCSNTLKGFRFSRIVKMLLNDTLYCVYEYAQKQCQECIVYDDDINLLCKIKCIN